MKLFTALLFSVLFGFGLQTIAQQHPDFEIIKQCEFTPVKSQDRAGTCWAYATTSFLESEIIRLGGNAYNLSDMFIVRNVYPKKAERYIRLHGNTTFGQGGQAHDVLKSIKRYGVVPESIYPGLNYGSDKHNHSILAKVLQTAVDEFANPQKTLPKNWTDQIEAILNGFLGDKPETFVYEGKTYTPKSFSQFLKIEPSDYIEITSYSHHPFHEAFVLEVPDNWSHDLYYNLPADDMMRVLKTSIENGYTIAWDGDVSGDGFNNKDGKAFLLEEEKELLREKGAQEFRQILFDNFTATDDHLMHLTGLAKDSEGNLWFQTKNSWGDTSNDFGGFLYMSEDYLLGMTIAFMVHKDALPKDIQKKLFK